MKELDFERIAAALRALTERERLDLQEWQRTHATSDGTTRMAEWPGWEAVFQRLGE